MRAMRRSRVLALLTLAACSTQSPATITPKPAKTALSPDVPVPPAKEREKEDDPYLWLEDIGGEKPLAWARERNAVTQKELEAAPGFSELRSRLRRIYDSKAKIPMPKALAQYVYNFWKDEAHPRGVWRRAPLAEYRKPSPKWELVLDVDALATSENESWVWQGATCLYPKYHRCLINLSRGGADAAVVRELDMVKKAFVSGGFSLPEAKSEVSWKDLDTLYVATDFGPGTLTDSGYPRIVKEWKRGTPLSAAKTLFEGEKTDMAVSGYREIERGRPRDWISRRPSFFTEELRLRDGDRLEKLDKPADAQAQVCDGQLLLQLRTDWLVGETIWPAGALLATPLEGFRAGKRDFATLYQPTPNGSLDAFECTMSAVLVVELEDVKSRAYLHRHSPKGWSRTRLDAPDVGSFTLFAYDKSMSDDFWFVDSGFTTPATLSLGSVATAKRAAIKKNPIFFEAEGVETSQHFATSKDGVRVPYFQVSKKGLPLDGRTPTVLDGYGGFEVSLTPFYDPTAGAAWIERGGVYVVANIRGGGEYGPAWHQVALKGGRQHAYDDFIAVAEDLIARKVTSTPKLGIIGGSNGGLLMGVMLTQRPELFGAIVCQVPLLDMKRYHKLLAGASWMEEYGDPDKPEDWAALATFSPYQNVKAGTRYPRTLFTTSTRDDRVHPGHARKMVARLLELGQDLLYYENIEGGHGGAANNEQRAHMFALAYSFFGKQLGLP